MEPENPVWLGEYVWEETPLDGGPPKSGPLPDEVLSMFRPQHCLLCGITTANMQTAYTHYESKGHFKKVIHHMREKYNALGSLKSNKEKFRTVKCDICNVDLTSRIVYLQHYDGKQHLKNMKKRGFKTPVAEEIPGESVPNPPASDADGSAPPPPLVKVGDYVCALCNVTTATRNQMQVHNNGSRHMKNVAKLADGELRDFYMQNGNCEPMDNDEMEGAAKDSTVSDQASSVAHRQTNPQPPSQMPPSDQSHGDYNGGYGPPGPPVDPSMMQSFPPQMPYGPYPQYPMPYDYSSWGQPNMYPGYNGPPPYNGQYGPGPYGPGPQQYPPYGYPQGPPPDYYNQQQQQFNPGQQPFNPGQQQFNPGPQQFNPGQFNQGPPQFNQGPQQYNQGQFNPEHQQQYNQGQNQSYDYHNNPNPHQTNQSNFGRDQHPNPSPKDPRRHSRNREPPKDPEVNETPLPDGVQLKPLAVLPFIKQMASDGPPGVDGPPGIDKNDDQYRNPPAPSFNDVVQNEGRNVRSNDKVEPKSPPLTLLDMIRENAKKSKRAKEEEEKAKASEENAQSPDAVTDLPPIPGLDIAPVDGKPPIITWSEGNKEGAELDLEGDSPLENDEGITPGDVVPPPPHPLNPPIHFLPESPEADLEPSNKKISPMPEASFSQPEVSSVSSNSSYSQPQVIPENSTQSYSQPLVSPTDSNTSQSQSHSQAGNLQPHYSHPPVPSSNAGYSQPLAANPQPAYQQMPSTQAQSYPQAPVNAQSAYPHIPNYNAPYISNPPVSYSQAPPTNYPQMYPQFPAENPQPYPQVPSAPLQMPVHQPVPHPTQSSLPTPPPVPPVSTQPETHAVPGPASTPTGMQIADDKTASTNKEDDSSKSAASKPKINSFFRRAAEKMFKEAKEKKMKEEAKKLENDSPKDPEPVSKSKEPSKDAIVIVPPSSGLKSEETTADVSAAANPGNALKARALESVSETDNDVGSEPGEIVDKKTKLEKIVEKVELTSTEAETPKSEKSKFDFSSKKISETRRKRSFRVRRSSVSRSKSRSRSPKRRGRRRSRSWSPSPEKSPVGYYQRNNFQSYYGNDTRYWRNDRVQYSSYNDWNEDYNDRRERRRNERDEFGRERKWKEEKKKEERKKKKRKSRKRSRSSSVSPPPRKVSKERKESETKKTLPSPSPPIAAKPERPKLLATDVRVDAKPVTVSLMQRLKGSLPTAVEKPVELFPKEKVPAKLVEEVKNTIEVRDIVIRPDVDSDEAREVEKEEQEILKKVALIKKKLLEKDEKPVKIKKRKKEKSKNRKKRKRSSSSSDSDSSSSESSSSSSSSSSASSSSSSTSAGSEPKSKRIVESLLSKLSRQATAGDTPPFELSMLPALVKKSKKSDVTKKKKKKDKKRKKKKKDKKKAPEPPLQVLSAFITPDGAYHCKCCNLTTSAGSAFLEHLISEKHKLLCKLISAK